MQCAPTRTATLLNINPWRMDIVVHQGMIKRGGHFCCAKFESHDRALVILTDSQLDTVQQGTDVTSDVKSVPGYHH